MSERRRGGDLDTLRSGLAGMGPVVVAFSGGADSAFLAWTATDTLGADAVLCATAVSPSLAPEELADCRALAAEWGLHHVEVETAELADPAYAANDGSRCYHCKTSLLEALAPLLPPIRLTIRLSTPVRPVPLVCDTPPEPVDANLRRAAPSPSG